MKRILVVMLFVLSCAVAVAQRVAISASQVVDSFGRPLSGRLCFSPVDASGNAIGFRVGAAQVAPSPVCGVVSSGVLQTGLYVYDSSKAVPTNVRYHVYAMAMSGTSIQRDYGQAMITGSAWSLDTWDPSAVALPALYTASATSGDLTTNGDHTVTGSESVAGDMQAESVSDSVGPIDAVRTTANAALPANGCSTTTGGNLVCGTVAASTITGSVNSTINPMVCAASNAPGWCNGPDIIARTGGSGYSTSDTITCAVTGGTVTTGGSAATCTATPTSAGTVWTMITNPGSYSTPPTGITITGGSGSGAAATLYSGTYDWAVWMDLAWESCSYQCTVDIPSGAYTTANTIHMIHPAQESLVGHAPVTLTYTGTGDQLLYQEYRFRNFFHNGTWSTYAESGEVRNLHLVRTSASAVNVHTGNVVGATWSNITATSTATSDAGKCFFIENVADPYEGYSGWFERNIITHLQLGASLGGTYSAPTGGCSYGLYAVQNGGTNSLGYNDIEGMANSGPGQVGIYLDGSGSTSTSPLSIYNGTLQFHDNLSSNSLQTLNPPEVVHVTANAAAYGELLRVTGENQLFGSGSTSSLYAYGINIASGSNGRFTGCGIEAINNTTDSGNRAAFGACGNVGTAYNYGLVLPSNTPISSVNPTGTSIVPLMVLDGAGNVKMGGAGVSHFYNPAACTASATTPNCISIPLQFDGSAWSGSAASQNSWAAESNSDYSSSTTLLLLMNTTAPSNLKNAAVQLPAIQKITPKTTVTGTTAGTAVWSEPEQGSAVKQVVLFLSGYENTTSTAQTVTVPIGFTTVQYVTTKGGSCSGVTFSGSTLTLPSSMSSTQTGLCYIEGY